MRCAVVVAKSRLRLRREKALDPAGATSPPSSLRRIPDRRDCDEAPTAIGSCGDWWEPHTAAWCLPERRSMRRHSLWAGLFIALVASALLVRRFSLLQLTPTQLRIASLPHAPVQMNRATIRCTLGMAVELSNANGQWRVIQDDPPCDVSGIVLQSLEATPAEMTKLNYCPLVSFDVSSSGIVSKVKLIRSSGSSTLDEKALRQVSSYRYPRHNCGACKVLMAVGVDFQGPVWMREPTVQAAVAH